MDSCTKDSGGKASSTVMASIGAQTFSPTRVSGWKANGTAWASTPSPMDVCTREQFSGSGCHGFGMMWSKAGKLMRCGRWEGDKLEETCPVPRNKLPFGSKLSEAAKQADLLLPDGNYCKGAVVDGWPEGVGTEFRPDGHEYTGGEWLRGKLVGPGWAHLLGKRFEGKWKYGVLRMEDGRVICMKGDKWDGVSEPSATPGHRKAHYLSGNVYFGEMNAASGISYGQGKMTFVTGSTYEGQWQEGKRYGLGQHAQSDGQIYAGEFANGRAHGLGMQWCKAGKLMRCGRWRDGKLVKTCPVPCSKLPFGSKLSASAKRADLLLPSGNSYKGAVVEGWPQGEGSEYLPDGRERASGTWRRGQLQGRGWAELFGERFEGGWLDGELRLADGRIVHLKGDERDGVSEPSAEACR